jgi:hypothetical protein
MKKDIEKLAKIGEELLIEKMEKNLTNIEDSINEFTAPLREGISRGLLETGIHMSFLQYEEIEDKFIYGRLDRTEYKKRFDELKSKYAEFKLK